MLFLDRLDKYKILLFSRSPRRKEILLGTGIEFRVFDGANIEERYPEELKGVEVARYLSRLKIDNYPLVVESDDVIITADTIVVLDGVVFGKPKDKIDAVKMLQALSGKTHSVITAFSIRTFDGISTFDVTTSVTFKTLEDEEIEFYVKNYKPFDKAGAYGIQEWIGYVGVEKIEGSYFNVMGLPICEVCQRLNEILE